MKKSAFILILLALATLVWIVLFREKRPSYGSYTVAPKTTEPTNMTDAS